MYSRWKACWNSAGDGSRLVGDWRVERALAGGMALGSCNAKHFPEELEGTRENHAREYVNY